MNKTQVKVFFSLFGDEFPLHKVTGKLELTPTKSYKKGDLIANRSKINRKETCWEIGTGYKDSLDVNDQLQQIVGNLQNKSIMINELKDAFSLECKFYIVIIIERGNSPSLFLDKDILKFASSIEAEFDVDIYANPYDETEE
ncbi:DUF4279 domain-containing protein [Neobacillus sp. YX16]|uniref:DUF4279 domain-containing protein n=1 Tax=Neobacillus sp. YX16 TaxID=3047874 RepID=UPI0024C368A9|nr:DUF4279 domain-containing protein [Neobacillus sp. YX16]WHZ02900.1 DUF4279 domain-containing protein [Neobacillus sp. YX16]